MFASIVMGGVQGELFEILEDDKNLPEAQVQAIAKQLVSMDISSFILTARVDIFGFWLGFYV